MTDQEFDRFLSTSPNLLVAPAGYGKTHTIARAVNTLRDKGVTKILVLTHTNAGISSIKEKFKKEAVREKGVTICTIAGFLQKIVNGLSTVRIEQDNDSNLFYSILYDSALELFEQNKILRMVVENSYEHIFIDEFQDCNRPQYEIVKVLCKWDISVHMLLDPLQTIFGFDPNHPDYIAFENRCREAKPDRVFQLDIPYRWRNVSSPLENYVAQWRSVIQDAIAKGLQSIDLSKLPGVTYHNGTYAEASRQINSLLYSPQDVLVLHSYCQANNEKARGHISSNTGYKLRVIESVDQEDFYNIAAKIDLSIQNSSPIVGTVYDILIESGVAATNLDKWIKNDRMVRKQSLTDLELSRKLHNAINQEDRKQAITDAIHVLTKEIKLKVPRVELLTELVSAISSAHISGRTVLEEMTRKRNIARVQGRKLYGKVIGTTLLTKGLEADSVVLLKPSDLFNNKDGLKHLYVALTRAINQVYLLDYS